MDNKQINIGLFGFGTVGKGLYDVLKKIQPENVSIVKVCVRNVAKHSAEAPELEFTSNADDIFTDSRINFIVELIDDAEAAYGIVKRALQAKIPVVSEPFAQRCLQWWGKFREYRRGNQCRSNSRL